MAIQGKITSLYTDKTMSEALLPRTNTKAITDDKGVNLNAILDQVAYVDTANSEAAVAPLNADTLAGFPADNYASKTYVSNEIAKAQLGGGSGEGNIDLSGFATKDDISILATKEELNAIDFPVDSVNGKTGAVQLSASDVGARSNTWMPTASDVGARPSDWMPSASDVKARPDTWMPSASDVGAAPAGYGLGGNGEPKNWSEIDNLISNGKYQIPNINQTINGINVTSASLDVIYYGYNYGKQILRTVETASGSSVSYTLERSRGYGGWEPWECDNPPFALGKEYRTTERIEGKPVYKKLINMGILAAANGVVSVPHDIGGATYIIGCRGIATQQGTQYGYEMASNDIQVEGGYVNWYDRNSTSPYYGYALISYLRN